MLIYGLLATLGWVGESRRRRPIAAAAARRLRLPPAVLSGLLATLGWGGEGPNNA